MFSSLIFRLKAYRDTFRGNTFVRIDASTMCQLKCPICPTSSGANRNGIIGWGHLKFDHFKKFADSHKSVKTIELSNWGEIFLNPELERIIEYAHQKGINLMARNGSNLNSVKGSTLEHLVKYSFKYLSISLDGSSNQTYQQYRAKGNFDKVIENIKLINHFKEQYHSEFPVLRWQFIAFGYNEHEIPKAREMARNLNMKFYLKLNYDSEFSPIKDPDFVKKAGGVKYSSREEYKRKQKKEYAIPCKQFWLSPQINWDGKLLGCCANIYSDYGNVFESGLDNCLQGEKYKYTKKMLLGIAPPRNDIACTHCTIYTSSTRAVASMF